MNISQSPLDTSWKSFLKNEFDKEYFKKLEGFIKQEESKSAAIFPERKHIFEAFNRTPLNKLKVVLIGQDPYHGEGQAHGLSFSVKKNVQIPPSLRNIYKELESDLSIPIPNHGDLTGWAKSGVLLLNNVLTVRKAQAGSHQKKGWEIFTDKVIEVINRECNNVVFILWGSSAQKKAKIVDEKKHKIIKSAHPSPLSSYRGFFGSKPFSICNSYLEEHNISKVDWTIK